MKTGAKTLSIVTITTLVFVGLFFMPVSTEALRCDTYGNTVVFVNGIFTDENEAKRSKEDLEDVYIRYTKDTSVNFVLAHNPSHISGAGDLAQTYYQLLGTSVGDFDLKNMLMRLHTDLSTQKVLLVGHSQGTFYTNEIYKYLIDNGLPESAVSVYNIATPANYVEGNGDYMTSANDNLINELRVWTAGLNINQPLQSNIIVPVFDSSTKPLWRGHSFRGEYLAGASVKIVSDINKAINENSSRDSVVNEGGCFNLPKKGLSYRFQQGGFMVLDGASGAVVQGTKAVGRSAIAVVETTKKSLVNITNAVDDLFATTVKNVQAQQDMQNLRPRSFGANVVDSVSEPEEVVETFSEPSPERERISNSSPQTPTAPPEPEPVSIPEIVEEIVQTVAPEPVVAEPVVVVKSTPEPVSEPVATHEPEPTAPATDNSVYAIPTYAIGGGGGGGAPADTTAPDEPLVVTPSDFTSAFSTTTISFVGTAEVDSVLDLTYERSSGTVSETVSVDGSGDWSVADLVFDQGTTTVSLTATDDSGNTSTATTVDVGIDTAPSAPLILIPTSGQSFSTSTIIFSGTASSSMAMLSDFGEATTTSDVSGNWSFTLSGLTEGDNTVGFSVTDSYGLSSATSSITVTVDTTVPVISDFSVLECDSSLNSSSCLAGGSPLNLSWTSTSTDISYYSIVYDGTVSATTTATTTTLALSDGTYSVQVAAYDNAGNGATSTAQSVEIDSMPVVINEIAWAGTKSSADDEWIELYNRRADTVELANVVIVADDGTPYIQLSGSIAANSYYLIERTDSTTTSVSEDLAAAFSGVSGSGLQNSGEVLTLAHVIGTSATTTLDATPSLADCGGSWCGGEATTTPISMERISVDALGTLSSNWSSNNTDYVIGTDSGSNNINGTPKSQNSVSLVTIGYFCPDETSNYTEGGYYSPTSGSCTYTKAGVTGAVYGDIYRGIIGNSTVVNGHYLDPNNPTSTENHDDIVSPVQGENILIAIYPASDYVAFRDYFQTGNSAPPHLNYGVLNWKYGTTP